MYLEQKEFSIIFNQSSDYIQSLLQDLVEKRDQKFVIYFPYFIERLADENHEKCIELFNHYFYSFPKIDKKVIYSYLDFIISKDKFVENINEVLQKYFELEEDNDKIYSLVTRVINSSMIQRIVTEVLLMFYKRIKDYKFANIYLKNLVKLLKSANRVVELENFLLMIYEESKSYWVIEALVEIYSSKQEYEKLVNVFLSIVTTSDFAKIWAESLGVIDKTLSKIVDHKPLILKIVPHLQNINILIDKIPKNIFNIYKSLLDSYADIPPQGRQEFTKAFINFIDIANSKGVISDDYLHYIVSKVIDILDIELFEKIIGILGERSSSIFQTVVNKVKDKPDFKEFTINLITSYYDKIDKLTISSYLNSLKANDWDEVYQAGLVKIIDLDIMANLKLEVINDFISSIIRKNDIQELEKKIEVLSKVLKHNNISTENQNILIPPIKIMVRLLDYDYVYVLSSLSELIEYPELLWYIYLKLRDNIEADKLKRMFIGLFLFYMDREDVDTKILENIKNELMNF
ncbi:MAG: hypothetical protein ABDH21_05190 [bacterium]